MNTALYDPDDFADSHSAQLDVVDTNRLPAEIDDILDAALEKRPARKPTKRKARDVEDVLDAAVDGLLAADEPEERHTAEPEDAETAQAVAYANGAQAFAETIRQRYVEVLGGFQGNPEYQQMQRWGDWLVGQAIGNANRAWEQARMVMAPSEDAKARLPEELSFGSYSQVVMDVLRGRGYSDEEIDDMWAGTIYPSFGDQRLEAILVDAARQRTGRRLELLQDAVDAIREMLLEVGYTEEDIQYAVHGGGVWLRDHRAQLVLAAAAQYHIKEAA